MKEFEVIRDGVTPNRALYQCLMASVEPFSGDFAEFGVHKGGTFEILRKEAARQMKRAHAFDSFTGMAAPQRPGDEIYPEGTFDVGGPDAFQEAFPGAIVHAGFIKDTLVHVEGLMLAFVHIDLDHYEPTLQTLQAVWPQLSPGGIMACHDFRFGQTCRAAGAISDWVLRMSSGGSIVDEGNVEHVLVEYPKVHFPRAALQYEGLSDMTIWFRKPIK